MGITEQQLEWVIGYFEGKGSYCITGSKPNKTFALEVFTVSLWPLKKLQALVGGHIYPPPPASPNRHTWRLYGRSAEELYSKLRPHLSERLTERGDRKLKICRGKLDET